MPRRRGEHGFYLIGILLALVVLCYLTLGYFEKNKQGVSTYNASIGAANRAQCLANQQVFATELMRWTTNNPGKAPTEVNLQESIPPVALPTCLDKGTISVDDAGQIHCSIHNPAPTPPPTPTPAPAIDLLANPMDESIATTQPAE